MTDSAFWKGRRTLVTGHTGFKGSWLSLWLQRMGADVVGYALEPPTDPSLFELAQVRDGMKSVIGDIRDLDRLRAVVRDHQPEVLLHLAAQSVVRESYLDAIETYSTNVVGTACVLEAARAVEGRLAVVVVTSDKCYENRDWPWGYRESDRLGGRDPYSSSKACAELVSRSFRDSFFPVSEYDAHGVALATARAGNVVGGGDWTPDQLIPDVMRAFEAGEAVRLRSPRAIRPWQHVLDCLAGYLKLAELLTAKGPEFSGAWNFGPPADDTLPVLSVVEALAAGWGRGASWQLDPGPHPHEASCLRLDSARARAELGWRPRLDLAQAIDWTLGWYRRRLSGEPPRDLCREQIALYEGMERPQDG